MTQYICCIWILLITSVASIQASPDTIPAATINPSSQGSCQESQPSTQAASIEYALAGHRFPSVPPSSLDATGSIRLTPTTVEATTVRTMSSQSSLNGSPLHPQLPGDHEHWAPPVITLPPYNSPSPTLPAE